MAGTFNTIFIICLVVAILFFVIAVVLFFLFDIRTIFNIRTGRAAARTIKDMEQANADTGHLRMAKTAAGRNTKKKATPQLSAPPVAAPEQVPAGYSEHAQTPPRGLDEATSLLSSQPSGNAAADDPGVGAETELLVPQVDTPDEGTTTTPQGSAAPEAAKESFEGMTERLDVIQTGETTVLSHSAPKEADTVGNIDDASDPDEFFFDVIKKIIRRDTDEIIR